MFEIVSNEISSKIRRSLNFVHLETICQEGAIESLGTVPTNSSFFFQEIRSTEIISVIEKKQTRCVSAIALSHLGD